MIKRLIFDVDGTLITGIDFTPFIEKTLEKINACSKENVLNFVDAIKTYETKFDNYNTNDYLNHIGSAINQNLKPDFINIFFEELKNAIPQKNEALINTIKELSKKYELVLLTNYFRKSQLNRLNNMGIGNFFTESYGEELIKPNLNSYLSACGKNNPNECIIIGDDPTLDIAYAQKAGVNTIFVNSKNISTENLNSVTVQSVIEINEELISKIERSEVLK